MSPTVEELGEAPDRRTAMRSMATSRTETARTPEDRRRLYQLVWGTDAPVPELVQSGTPGRDLMSSAPLRPDPLSVIYGGAYGPWPNTAVVPSLDFATKQQKAPLDYVKANALLLPPVWRIAFQLASIAIKVYEFTEQASTGRLRRQEAPLHPAYALVRQPNPYMTRNRLIGGTVVGMFVSKGVGWIKRREGGVGSGTPPVALYPVPVNMLWPMRGTDRPVDHYELRGLPGYAGVPIPVEDVIWHSLMADPSDWASGFTPMSALTDPADTAQAALDALDDVFESGLLVKLWINANKQELDDEAVARISAQMAAAANRRFGIPIFGESGESLESVGDAVDVGGTMIRTIEELRILIYDVFGIDPKDDDAAFWLKVGLPLADAIEQELERSLMSEWPNRPAFPQFAMRERLLGTPLQRAQYHKEMIYSAQEMPAEARDEDDRAFVDGSEVLLVPLNMVPLPTQEERLPGSVGPQVPPGSDQTVNPDADQGGSPAGGTPTKGSSNGLGGSQGKGTTGPTPPLPTPAKRSPIARMRAARRTSYGTLRSRTINTHASAMTRRLSGAAKDAKAAVRGLLVPENQRARYRNGSVAPRGTRRAAVADLPSAQVVLAALEPAGDEVATIVAQFMAQAGEDAWQRAADYAGEIERQLGATLDHVFATRSRAVADYFVTFQADAVAELLDEALANALTIREVDAAIASRLGDLATNLVDGIGRSETAWGYEQSAMTAWRTAGISILDFVQGGGPCTTGVCDEAAAASPYTLGDTVPNVGWSFDGADAAPLHPGCECFSVPHEEDAGEAGNEG